MKTQTEKNGKIQLMRFVFALAVVLFHLGKDWLEGGAGVLGIEKLSFFRHGNMGVEFFFLVSGFLMARSIRKRMEEECLHQSAENYPPPATDWR